jgi:hypothetical protein
MKKLVIPIFFCFFTAISISADNTIVQIAVDGTSNSEVPVKAKTDSLKDAINKGSLQVIGNLIGPVKLEKNLPVIRAKILSQVSKFVQFYKASDSVTKSGETVTSVTMKISVTSLRDLLAAENLLYQSEGLATILPLLKVTEKKDRGQQYSWWSEEVTPATQELRDDEKAIFHQFDLVFRPKNFYVIDPLTSHYVQWVPAIYRNEDPTMEQTLWLGEFFKAEIVLTGDVTLEQANTNTIKLSARVVAYHTSNGRIVGEVTRNFEMPSRDWEAGVIQVLHKGFTEISKDLASQVLDESTRGTLGATQLRITLRGNFNYQDLENFKKEIMIKMGDVKTIRERRQEKGQTTFEVDYAGVLPNLVKSLETSSFDGFKIAVQGADNNEINVRWSK